MKIIPETNRLLVKPKQEEDNTTKSGIILSAKEPLDEAARGSVLVSNNNNFIEGDVVIYSRYGADKVTLKGEEFHIVSVESVIGKIYV